MPVPTGTASMLDIQNEFGGSAPISLSEYYGAASGVPTSGTISINDFRGKSSIFTFTISSTQVDANLRSLAVAAGWNQSVAVVATIGSGVNINGSVAANSTAALTIDGSWPGGVTLINNGAITGRGGAGRAGSYFGNQNGEAGGRALSVSVAVTINNLGTIAGGGGGGAAGRATNTIRSCDMGETDATCRAIGGGGGGGQSNTSYNGLGGSGSSTSGINCTSVASQSGSAGTSTAAGSGGAGGYCVNCACSGANVSAAAGASGGAHGAAGGNTFNGTGGAAGEAVNGNSNITWTNTGTLLGTIV